MRLVRAAREQKGVSVAPDVAETRLAGIIWYTIKTRLRGEAAADRSVFATLADEVTKRWGLVSASQITSPAANTSSVRRVALILLFAMNMGVPLPRWVEMQAFALIANERSAQGLRHRGRPSTMPLVAWAAAAHKVATSTASSGTRKLCGQPWAQQDNNTYFQSSVYRFGADSARVSVDQMLPRPRTARLKANQLTSTSTLEAWLWLKRTGWKLDQRTHRRDASPILWPQAE